MTATDVLHAFAGAMHERDWDALADLLAPDFAGLYVHSGERWDKERFVAVNRDYPGEWAFDTEQVIGDGERAAGRPTGVRAPGHERTPHAPGRACLPLLHSCPGGVRRGTAT